MTGRNYDVVIIVNVTFLRGPQGARSEACV